MYRPKNCAHVKNKILYKTYISDFYLRQGGNAFARVCLSVCVLER